MLRLGILMSGAALLAGTPLPAAAQWSCEESFECPAADVSSPSAGRQLQTVGINALLGGVTAAATRIVRGEPVGDAFWNGAIGGGLIYAGKRVAVEDFGGAGLLGRELASVGGSVIRNAAAGRGVLEEVVLPAGPVRFYISRNGVVPRVDVATLVAAGSFVLAHDAKLDLSETISSGALVFRAATPAPGLASAGAVAVWADDDMPDGERARLLAHERVHVLQYDQAFLTWDEGIERWLAARSPAGRGFLNHVDLGALSVGLRGGLGLALQYGDRPWEREAYLLSAVAHPVSTTLPHAH
jgi:hypothetical protein